MFEPKFHITGKIAKVLMAIEADRQVVANLPLTAPMLDSLRRTARLLRPTTRRKSRATG